MRAVFSFARQGLALRGDVENVSSQKSPENVMVLVGGLMVLMDRPGGWLQLAKHPSWSGIATWSTSNRATLSTYPRSCTQRPPRRVIPSVGRVDHLNTESSTQMNRIELRQSPCSTSRYSFFPIIIFNI